MHLCPNAVGSQPLTALQVAMIAGRACAIEADANGPRHQHQQACWGKYVMVAYYARQWHMDQHFSICCAYTESHGKICWTHALRLEVYCGQQNMQASLAFNERSQVGLARMCSPPKAPEAPNLRARAAWLHGRTLLFLCSNAGRPAGPPPPDVMRLPAAPSAAAANTGTASIPLHEQRVRNKPGSQ